MAYTPLQHPHLRVAYHNVTVAEYNAGFYIIPPSPGRYITVVDCWMRSAGNTTECTSIDLTDGTTSAAVFLAAALTNGTMCRIGASNTTATNLGTTSARGTGIKVLSQGTDETTATAVEVCVYYTVSSTAAAS